jgi:hypothetical protein
MAVANFSFWDGAEELVFLFTGDLPHADGFSMAPIVFSDIPSRAAQSVTNCLNSPADPTACQDSSGGAAKLPCESSTNTFDPCHIPFRLPTWNTIFLLFQGYRAGWNPLLFEVISRTGPVPAQEQRISSPSGYSSRAN